MDNASRVVKGRIESFCRLYNGPYFHAVLCDPPYHLTSIVKRFSEGEPEHTKTARDIKNRSTPHARQAAGFMGKKWDGGDIAFRPETWKAIASLCYPGAFIFAFAGTRGYHRMAVAMEDAGLIIHPAIGWVTAQGFPKATKIRRCECEQKSAIQKAWRDNCVSELRNEEIHTEGMDKEIEESFLFSKLQGENGNSTNIDSEQIRQNGNEVSGNWTEWRKESIVEGRGDISTQEGKLRVGEVRSMSEGISSDGEAGRIHNGASFDNGEDDWEIDDSNGSSTPHRSQSTKQRDRKSGTVAGQQESQDGRAWKNCDRCGQPIIDDRFEGYRYGLQALKPAFEFIAVAQVPYKGKPIKCITESGAGALNIEGARISTSDNLNGGSYGNTTRDEDKFFSGKVPGGAGEFISPSGRWPSNFILSHTPLCRVGECVEGCPIKMLNEQSGVQSGGYVINHTNGARPFNNNGDPTDYKTVSEINESDSGASRFFFNSDWMYERLEESDPIAYQAKAGKSERNAGLGDMPDVLGGSLSGGNDTRDGKDKPQLKLTKNNHPTVKSISLCKYLATLLLPPDSYSPRRILIPFSGSGSEMIGARLAGWEKVIGVEMTEEYVEIARARLAWWEEKIRWGHEEVDRVLEQWRKEEESESGGSDATQLDMFGEAG